ncbi:hypothetical protein GCM10007390_32860 [Persicitalea jodogahamensis]|uniref:DUF2975 domain-containing protein n=2 Tax=Persicitalea jodogahamensis TaxID=402147 RepID=A0A8J3GBB3_9BACT|nr:hypothetical protein GCM10007390_32860 [Persicitalea jodogahamensis]
MTNQSPTWVFTTAGLAVNLVYYFTMLAAAIFIFISVLRLLNLQPPQLTFGEQFPNRVSIPVDWEKRGDVTLTLPEEFLVSLNPGERKGELQVPIHSTLGLSYTFFILIALIGSVWFFWLLRQIFHHTRADLPFLAENARRISQMGLLIIASSLFSEVYDYVIWSQSKPYIEAMSPGFYSGLSYSLSLNGPWVFGLVLLAVAQVYRRGVELQQENALTV